VSINATTTTNTNIAVSTKQCFHNKQLAHM
jgi:hypothetical protein